MKVILLKDVPGTGKAGAICEVKEGHAHNYLIPRGLARVATEGAVRALEDKLRAEQRRVDHARAQVEALAKKLEGLVVEVRAKAGEGGRLFGSVTSQQVVDALAARGVTVTRKQVELDEPIRAQGFYRVPVRVGPGLVAHIDLNVVGTR